MIPELPALAAQVGQEHKTSEMLSTFIFQFFFPQRNKRVELGFITFLLKFGFQNYFIWKRKEAPLKQGKAGVVSTWGISCGGIPSIRCRAASSRGSWEKSWISQRQRPIQEPLHAQHCWKIGNASKDISALVFQLVQGCASSFLG